ncbi:MAG: hypothetical protein Altm2KO_21760 [Alteromonas macleodii]|jgi:hypothetical protein
MKVKIQGFELSLSNGVGLPELFQLMESGQNKTTPLNNDEYVYMVDVKDNFIIGLLLRFSDVKKFITTSRGASGELLIKVPDLTDENLDDTEASIFCINPHTLRGAFYTYRRSLTRRLLTTLLNRKHNFLKNKRLQDLTDEYSQLDPEKRKAAAAKATKEITGSFNFELLCTQASIDLLLDSYDEISEMSVTAKDGLPDGGLYSPSSPFVKSTSVTTKFEKNKSQSFVEQIKGFVRKVSGNLGNDDAIKLYGKLESGAQAWLSLGENISEFDILHFDRFVDMLPEENEDWKEYVNCAATVRLINLLKTETAVFGEPPKDSQWRLPSAATENSKIAELSTLKDLGKAS